MWLWLQLWAGFLLLIALFFLGARLMALITVKGKRDSQADALAQCSIFEQAYFLNGMEEVTKMAFFRLFTSHCLEEQKAKKAGEPAHEYRIRQGVDISMLDPVEQKVASRLENYNNLPRIMAEMKMEETRLNDMFRKKMEEMGLITGKSWLLRSIESSYGWFLWILTFAFIVSLVIHYPEISIVKLIAIIIAMMYISWGLPGLMLRGTLQKGNIVYEESRFPDYLLTGNYRDFAGRFGKKIREQYGLEIQEALERNPAAAGCSV